MLELFTAEPIEHFKSFDFPILRFYAYLSLNKLYLNKSSKWDWTQVITTLVKSLPYERT